MEPSIRPNNKQSFASVVAGQPNGARVAMTTPTNSAVNVVNNALRKQGIAFNALEENVPIEVYLDAISTIVPTNATTHISKSSRMINVYFSSATWADQLIRDGLDVKDFHLDVRPVATTPIKVIISNVPPEIGHQWLRGEMSHYGRVVGPIKTLAAATSRPEYSHIRSFRRMILMEFANDDAMERLPRQMNYTLDGKPYSFYTSLDVKCFKCGKMGHFRRNCSEPQVVVFEEERIPVEQHLQSVTDSGTPETKMVEEENTVTEGTTSETPTSPSEFSQPEICKQTTVEKPSSGTEDKNQRKKRKKKRRLSNSPISDSTTKVIITEESDSVSVSSSAVSDMEDMPPFEDMPPLESDVESRDSECIESGVLDNFSLYSPLSQTTLLAFLSDVKGSPHRLRFAKKHTDDISGLIDQLKDLGLHLKKTPIKSKSLSYARISRVHKGLYEEFYFNA